MLSVSSFWLLGNHWWLQGPSWWLISLECRHVLVKNAINAWCYFDSCTVPGNCCSTDNCCAGQQGEEVALGPAFIYLLHKRVYDCWIPKVKLCRFGHEWSLHNTAPSGVRRWPSQKADTQRSLMPISKYLHSSDIFGKIPITVCYPSWQHYDWSAKYYAVFTLYPMGL